MSTPTIPPSATSSTPVVTTATSWGDVTYRWVLAWAVFLALLWLANQSEIGHRVIYYLLVLSIVLMLVTQYRWLSSALAPLATVTGGPKQAS